MKRFCKISKALKQRFLEHSLLVILILSLAIRLGASQLYITGLDAVLKSDEFIFTRIAWNLVLGNGYSQNSSVPTAERPPAYPLLLAGVFSIFGKSWAAQDGDSTEIELYRSWPTVTSTQARNYRIAARLLNIAISCLTVAMLYLIGDTLFGKDIAIVAGLVGAIYLPFIRESIKIVSDTLSCFTVSLIICIFVRIQAQPDSVRLKLLGGTLVGIGILTRSELLLFVPFLCLWALLVHRRLRKTLATCALFLLPILLLVLPWVVRNYVVFDELMMATNVGYVVWGVHNPDTFADLNLMGKWVPPDAGFRNAGQRYSGPLDPAYRYLPEPEWNRQLFRMGLDSIRQNIRSLPRMELYKLHRLIFAGGAVRNLFRFPLLYSFVFGLIILLLASKSERPLLILYMLIAFSVLTTLVFYTNPRLRMSVDPAFIIILSYGLIEQIRMIDLSRKNRGWLPM